MVSLRTIALSAITFGLPLAQALTAQQVVDNVKTLTRKSQALQAPANRITLVNSPLIIIGQGPFPELIRGFTDIVTTATTIIASMPPPGVDPITTVPDATLVADAFREFVRVHQVLLNILIGKAGILQNVPFIGPPVAAVLRQVEGVVDAIAFGLIDMISPPPQKAQASSDAESLSGTIDLAISTYQGILG